jgi:hypothetical protein
MIELLNFLALSADKQETSYGETAWIARHAAKTIAALTAAEQAGDDIDWNADARRLSGCLLAIHGAKTASASALRSVAYDAALNCIMPDVAEFQCDHRTAAAQVGGPSETEAQAIMAEAAALAEVEELKDKLAATIERCAQVAKANVTGEEAAEDILALKD